MLPSASSPRAVMKYAKHAIPVADERVRAVPLVDIEVGVEIVRDRVPRDRLPPHSLLHAGDAGLWRPRDERERGVARVEMGGGWAT